MTDGRPGILGRIGGTSLLPLRHIVAANGARIMLKVESENPTGSMKDRMALAMIESAEADGRLRAGGSVVEYTGGSTGVSLALICAVKGHPLHIVTSDAFSREKLDHMQILGATLQIVPSESGRMTENLTRDMIGARHERRRALTAHGTDCAGHGRTAQGTNRARHRRQERNSPPLSFVSCAVCAVRSLCRAPFVPCAVKGVRTLR